jgi:hypothetical protein
MKRKPIHPVLRTVYKGVNALHLRSYEIYQPVTVEGRASEGSRDCEVRWNAVRSALDRHQCKSLVDLGCSEGYYVLQAARHGIGFCVGVDFDLRRIWTCQNQVLLNDIPHAAFLVSEVEPGLVGAMPKFDAVVFLSVLHHILYSKGEDYARELLRTLSSKVGKVMIFEMGQSDERSESWASRVPDMGADPHAWIASLLESCGFASVEKVAEAPAYGREVNRAIFECTPA